MREVAISDRKIGAEHPCFIIAEAGINHNGDADTAHRMIDAAADSGADCIKFQTYTAEAFCSGKDDTFEYVSQGETIRESMLELFKRHELTATEFSSLFEHARQRGIVPLSTPCDRASVELLDKLDVPAFKIGSDDLIYHDLVAFIASKGKPVIFSVGMGDLAEITQTLSVIEEAGNTQAIMLHCVSVYPTPPDQVNLRKILSLQDRFDTLVGYSDHSEGIDAVIAARAMGAAVIEKHFTLDRTMTGPDHWFSSDPEELSALVDGIRRTDVLMGSQKLEPSPGEQDMRLLARRSIVAARDLTRGQIITREDLAFRRPGTGLPPSATDQLIGRKLKVSVPADNQIAVDDVD